MCGRFTLHGPGDELKAYFEADGLEALPARYNIAPTQNVLALRIENNKRHFTELSWGLVPSWAKDKKIAYKMINARSETASEKPSFRKAMQARRCIIPASGYYEWQRIGKQKQPYYITHPEEAYLSFAGLWERWVDPSGSVHESCTILTMAAHQDLAWLHHRMPVLLSKESFGVWLGDGPLIEDAGFFAPQNPTELKSHAVSLRVNGVAHDDVGCIKETDPVVIENLSLL